MIIFSPGCLAQMLATADDILCWRSKKIKELNFLELLYPYFVIHFKILAQGKVAKRISFGTREK
jgi:hypothetical protein